MARETVEVIGASAASPEAVWCIASDFCGAWHPAIATIHAERDERGALVRAFTVDGEDTVYREQLTWLSDSDRTLAYTHLQGIVGAEAYDGRIAISAGDGGGSSVRWSARVEAASPRLQVICEGTKAIFEAGIAALSETALATRAAEQPGPLPAPAATRDIVIDGDPRLALTATPDGDGPLCLFLHGIGGSRGNWLPQLGAVGGVTRAAALDLRGYGGSALGRHPSTVEDYCDDIPGWRGWCCPAAAQACRRLASRSARPSVSAARYRSTLARRRPISHPRW